MRGRLPIALRPVFCGPMVRCGRHHDGGYVLPAAALGHADGLISLGLNDDWSFDRDFAARHRMAPIACYDPTISHGKFILKALGRTLLFPLAALIKPRDSLSRLRQAWHAAVDYGRFFRSRAVHHRLWISGNSSPGARSLSDAIAEPQFSGRSRLVIKMDIEGAEYAALATLSDEALSRSAMLLVEFHRLGAHLEDVLRLARRLKEAFVVAHVHANNYAPVANGVPEVIEVVWIRKTLLTSVPAGEHPGLPLPGLDQPNHPRRADIELVFSD